MNKQELVEELKRRIETRRQCYGASYCEAVEDCLALVRQLDEPPAMEWLDKPRECDRDGKGRQYHIENHGVSDIRWERGEWLWLVYFDPRRATCSSFWSALNGRRVCPIPPPPPLPEKKEGDK